MSRWHQATQPLICTQFDLDYFQQYQKKCLFLNRDKETFNELISKYFKFPNTDSAKEKTMLHAIETGKIQAGEDRNLEINKELTIILEVKGTICKYNSANPITSNVTA